MTTALAKIDQQLPSAPLARVADLKKQFEMLEGKVNIISPVASVDTIPALHGISLRAVTIDGTVDDKGNGAEVYKDGRFCSANERALGGVALQKIAAAAGVTILTRRRLDDHSDPYYCEIEITIGIRDFDGTWRQVSKAKEMDLRDGAPETQKKGPNGQMISQDPSAVADKRRHIASHAETKAFYRALRTLLNLKQKYTVAELQKPFVVPKLVPALDPSDPDQKRALIAMALGTTDALYGRERGPAAALPQPSDASTRVLEEAGTKPPPPVKVVETKAAPAEVVPPAEDSEEDFEPVDLSKPDPEMYVCACPCGDQREISKDVAVKTSNIVGAPRCSLCFPGPKFDYKTHKDLSDLGLPKLPGKTTDDVRDALAAKAKK